MHNLNDTPQALAPRTGTKWLRGGTPRDTFFRTCSSHYILVVLPELRRFEQHLKKQEMLVAISPIQPLEQDVLQAGLMIEYPVDTTNLLEIRYDFGRQVLGFSQLFAGHRNQEPDHQFSIASIDKITSGQLYDIIKGFVTSVLALQVAARSAAT